MTAPQSKSERIGPSSARRHYRQCPRHLRRPAPSLSPAPSSPSPRRQPRWEALQPGGGASAWAPSLAPVVPFGCPLWIWAAAATAAASPGKGEGNAAGHCPLPAGDLYSDILQVLYYGWELSRFIMSKTSLRRKVASTKITNWVEPSFDDFVGNTDISSALTTASLGVNNFHQRRKDFSSTLENNKLLPKKKGKSSSSKQSSVEANLNENLTENEPWVDKYKPETQNELAVHKKKIEELETWLKAHVFEKEPKLGGSILIITGPPGCGKTATLQILVKELGITLQEWINPVFLDSRRHDMKDEFNHESSFHVVPNQSQVTIFQEFLLRANKYNKLQMVGDCLHTDKKMILVEDMPNQFYRDPSTLHEILRRFVQLGRCPLIFIISDSLSGDSNQRLLFPKEIQEECSISNISFNPVAPTIMMKVLSRIAVLEANMGGGKIVVPDKSSLELLCKGCSGDIRSAINSLQFSSFKEVYWNCLEKRAQLISTYSYCNSTETSFWSRKKGMSSLKSDALLKAKQKKRPDTILENQEIQAIGGKDASLFLFRALGKILYCKNFFTEIEDLERASEYMSVADIFRGDWNSRTILGEYSASVATRGVMHSNKSRGFAYCPGGGASFRPLHKPQWFLINRKYRENCLAAKSLFSSFCLPPLCLQTQLLPYLAMLTNPMRNQAQIAFIQDVGRFPLRRFFGRLKMEALTDKDSGMIDSASDDEANFHGVPPTKTLMHMDKIKTSETDIEASLFLPSSQTSGTDLPASQPQPATAQGFMEEEKITIEEYDSDEM
ncbi:cell cycle checkpoint protein RAD17 isoform X3 [Sarcophilus harrisii]|uniref:cell cycle checkpoint protein RAD17 isoform X3 n=1 Tax=Sarcophilus harrisii TaxID=9305 RepID=UPI001301BBD2|nr:cell cycle checkpoint protein RAD17 isoform X3 [Sarcophilus harrisii]